MEGAAFAYVCAKMKVNAIQIRSISNQVEPRNRNNWNIPLAIKNLNEVLGSLCEEIGKGLYIIIRNSKWNSK
jgi:futalosine hydrolase